MPRRRRVLLVLGVAGALCALALGGQVALRLSGVSLLRETPQAVSAMLRPHYRVVRPEGAGPFPTALLASGCDGPQDNLELWAAALRAEGWASITVDSHTPRGYGADPLWRLVCTGAALPGGARAGDLAVALADARAMPFVDARRLALIGASHGGWAVLDLLALADRRRPPETLTAWPRAPGDDALAGVVAAIAVYPYCGEASSAGRRGWRRAVPVLMVLVEDDTIVDEADCAHLAQRQRDLGLPVRVELFHGVTHGFDQEAKSPLSPLRYDSVAALRLSDLLRAFLEHSISR